MEIRFLGGAGTVTGSKFLVESNGSRILVDCGLFQGLKALRSRNWAPFPVDPRSIGAVILTHAHIDHSGYLPVLVRQGFAGKIWCTPPTADLAGLLLRDSGKIQEEEAEYANRKGYSRHAPARPLYTEEDARRVIGHFAAVPFGEEVRAGGLSFRFVRAGHILGAGSVILRGEGRSVLFSGDIGRPADPLMVAPEPAAEPEFVVMESTYGSRQHGETDPKSAIVEVVRRTFGRGGAVLVPAFAVGRAQLVLHCLKEIFDAGEAPRAEIAIDSPMATDVTELYVRHAAYHRLTKEQAIAMCRAARFVNSVEESKALDARAGPRIIISASGMLTGGRVLHHVRALGPDPRNVILLPGYQAPGTRGGSLAAGARKLRIHGGIVPIRAEVIVLDVFSGHADQDELVRWVQAIGHRPRKVLLVHGSPEAADALRACIEAELDLPVGIPEMGETVSLS